VIEVDEQFDVPASPDRVWSVLSDPQAVVSCVPGATITAEHDDGTFEASVTVKFGPMRVGFQSRVAMELDEAARQGRLSAQGRDKQGGTKMRGTATFRVAEQSQSAGSSVAIKAEVEISGKLASLVEGGATVVVKRMSAEFAENLAARCRAVQPA
jgi:carbon monoxide dehydrogenase subunit G